MSKQNLYSTIRKHSLENLTCSLSSVIWLPCQANFTYISRCPNRFKSHSIIIYKSSSIIMYSPRGKLTTFERVNRKRIREVSKQKQKCMCSLCYSLKGWVWGSADSYTKFTSSSWSELYPHLLIYVYWECTDGHKSISSDTPRDIGSVLVSTSIQTEKIKPLVWILQMRQLKLGWNDWSKVIQWDT